MKISKKPLFIIMGLFILLSLAACSGRKTTDAPLEAVFPKDATSVFVVDYSDEFQVENFENLIAKFPETEFKGQFLKGFKAGFNSGANKNDFSWEEDVGPLFEGRWKMGAAVILPENLLETLKDSVESLPSMQAGDIELYIAVKLSEDDKLRDLIDKFVEKKFGVWGDAKYEEDDGIDYWTNEKEDLYAAFYGDLFFMTTSKGYRDAAIKRIESEDGFNKNEKFALKANNLASKNLGYVFVNAKIFSDVYVMLFGLDAIDENFKEQIAGIGDVFAFWSAESDGFRIATSTAFNQESETIKKLLPDQDYKISLIDKINGDGVFFYSENAGVGGQADYIIETFEKFENDAIENPGADIFKKFTSFLEKIKVLLDSPKAVVMSDSGEILPTISLYFQLEDKNVAEAKKLIIELDEYVDELIVEADKMEAENGGSPGILKKSIEATGGGGLRKLYVDWSALSDSEKALFGGQVPGFDFTTTKVELYYGLTGDNVFVLAFYPDFPNVYGKNPLSQNKNYQEAIVKLGDIYGFSVSYIRTDIALKFVERLLNFYAAAGLVPEDMMTSYDLYGRRFVGTIKYMVGSSIFKDGVVDQSFFVKVEEVK